MLSESRCGISLSEKEISHLDEIIFPLLRKKHSLHHICIHHPDSVMVSESTLYRFVDYNLFSARNIDMPKGTSLDPYTQEDISIMMDHINSYSRPSLGNKCPYEMMEFLYGEK